ncbi:MAG: dolichol-phosphate mannosyltransferase [Chitinophagales bacterium]|nr:MAG: dolichol-phosphate mannosyltransferase [Chitinophagales bacterium]
MLTVTTGRQPATLSVIVPAFKSAPVLPELLNRLRHILEKLVGLSYEIIFVDDCSPDNTWVTIRELASQNPRVHGIRLGKNAGQWMAALAGMAHATGQYIVTIDDDLEHDPSGIEILYRKITSEPFYLIFGMAPDKYHLKSRYPRLARLSQKAVNFLWHKYPTDSFKIFRRTVVFHGETFEPKLHFEAFIKQTLDARLVGYAPVPFNPRYHGSSNHPLRKKLWIFLRYTPEYYPFPGKSILAFFFFIAVFSVLTIVLSWKSTLIFHAAMQTILLILILIFVWGIYGKLTRTEPYRVIDKTSGLNDGSSV